MTPNEYQDGAVRTCAPTIIMSAIISGFQNKQWVNHPLSLVRDLSKNIEQIKKLMAYGKWGKTVVEEQEMRGAITLYERSAVRSNQMVVDIKTLDSSGLQLLHGLLGLIGELHEVMEAMSISPEKLADELGDLLWYMAVMCDAADLKLEDVMIRNNAKLRARFPEKFEARLEIAKNLEAEAAAQEAAVLPSEPRRTRTIAIPFVPSEEKIKL